VEVATMKIFVSNTTASCTGFLFKAEGSEGELAAVRRAAEAFNAEAAWRDRGCDGNVSVQDDEAAVVAFWTAHVETEARSLKEVEAMLEDDGGVIRCAPGDLADFLGSLYRQTENLFPGPV
jgi:hypothetical protein